MARGNRTERRGRKRRLFIELTDEASRKLRQVWTQRSVREPGLTEDAIVNALILAMPDPDEDWYEWTGDIL